MASKPPPTGGLKQATLSEPALREHDYATSNHTTEPKGGQDDTETESNTSDEFDWSEDDDELRDPDKKVVKTKARRGRALYLAFMKLARPLRITFLQIIGTSSLNLPICLLSHPPSGCGILITPLLFVSHINLGSTSNTKHRVFELRFKSSSARSQVFAWSLWLSIIWAAGCTTSIFVDLAPRLFIRLIDL
jgi:hypothetical protein